MKNLVLIVLTALVLSGCDIPVPEQSARQTQQAKAAEAANSIKFTENAEIENIKKRLELTSNPGLTGFILLLNQAGQPIKYTSVKGKITSGGKRLTSPSQVIHDSYTTNGAAVVMPAPSDEGTMGSSGDYIFFWTTNGEYIQWNGDYLYSDKPFRLKVEPLVVDIQTAVKAEK